MARLPNRGERHCRGSLFILAYCRLLPDVKEANGEASVAANDTEMRRMPQNLRFKSSLDVGQHGRPLYVTLTLFSAL